ncbi:hypothetical protein [Geomicrobium sediminis]|uniref:Uncharacterized protein n=1 Tax=Geomicrobium sediminis TaxID=1347788 RepID=A0ABS2PHC8_9BACL|nr:hypothetical protein [Geomicrobium sediminis]MBM7634849.1 hypothetical protein [Geomicrobium sediminis]
MSGIQAGVALMLIIAVIALFFAGVRVVVDRTLGTFYDNLFRKCYQLYRTIVERLR